MAFLFTFWYPKNAASAKPNASAGSKRSLDQSVGDIKQQPVSKKIRVDIEDDEQRESDFTENDVYESPNNSKTTQTDNDILNETQDGQHIDIATQESLTIEDRPCGPLDPASTLAILLLTIIANTTHRLEVWIGSAQGLTNQAVRQMEILKIWICALIGRLLSIMSACAGG